VAIKKLSKELFGLQELAERRNSIAEQVAQHSKMFLIDAAEHLCDAPSHLVITPSRVKFFKIKHMIPYPEKLPEPED
jgi:hypothetical protein